MRDKILCPHCVDGELLSFEPFVLSCYKCGYEKILDGFIDWSGVESGCVKISKYVLAGGRINYWDRHQAVLPAASR